VLILKREEGIKEKRETGIKRKIIKERKVARSIRLLIAAQFVDQLQEFSTLIS